MGKIDTTTFVSNQSESVGSETKPFIIDLRTIAGLVARHKIIFFASIAGFLALAILYLQLAPHRYSVSIQLAPVVNSNSEIAGRLGALSSLAGVNLGQDPNGQLFDLYREGLKSRAAADRLAQIPSLMQRVFEDQWSEKEGVWHEPPSEFRPILNFLRSILGIPVKPWSPPTGEQVYEILQRQLDVIQDTKSPIVVVTIEQSDPGTGAELLLALSDTVDRTLRERALARADQYITYLTQQLNRVTASEIRQALIENLSQQEKIRMMANAGRSFVSDVFSGPSVSPYPSSPNVSLVLGFALVFGVITGLSLAAWRDR
jgi:uncharacterized protein involved in exopolysaccharide biosynthesis